MRLQNVDKDEISNSFSVRKLQRLTAPAHFIDSVTNHYRLYQTCKEVYIVLYFLDNRTFPGQSVAALNRLTKHLQV